MNVYEAVETQLFRKILKANKLKAIPGPADIANDHHCSIDNLEYTIEWEIFAR